MPTRSASRSHGIPSSAQSSTHLITRSLRLYRRITGLIAGVAIIAATMGVSALSPSLAAASCPKSTFCLYSGTYLSGTEWRYSIEEHSQNAWHSVGSGAEDKSVSYFNNRVHATYIEEGPGAQGLEACINPEGAKYNLEEWDWPYRHASAAYSIKSFYLTSEWTSCEGLPQLVPA